jgi:hypothetical protein
MREVEQRTAAVDVYRITQRCCLVGRRVRIRRRPSEDSLEAQLAKEFGLTSEGRPQSQKLPAELHSPDTRVALDSLYASMDSDSNRRVSPEHLRFRGQGFGVHSHSVTSLTTRGVGTYFGCANAECAHSRPLHGHIDLSPACSRCLLLSS